MSLLIDLNGRYRSPKARKYWPITIACGVVYLGLFRAMEHHLRLCLFGMIAPAEEHVFRDEHHQPEVKDNLPGFLYIVGGFPLKHWYISLKPSISLVPGHCPQQGLLEVGSERQWADGSRLIERSTW